MAMGTRTIIAGFPPAGSIAIHVLRSSSNPLCCSLEAGAADARVSLRNREVLHVGI